MKKFDIAILGGGPGGYVAALHAAREGASVVIVERDRPGGTCLHRGCIPTKALLHAADLLDRLKDSSKMGIRVDGLSLDLAGLRQHRDRAVRTVSGGVKALLSDAGVEVIKGTGRIAGSRELVVTVDGGGDEQRIQAGKALIIATGSVSSPLPLPDIGTGLWDSDRALEVQKVPATLTVIGGGAVGLELASIYRALGASVTVVEAMPRLLPREDAEVSQALETSLKRKGIEVLTGARIGSLERSEGTGAFVIGLESRAEGQRLPERLESEEVLVAVGRRPAVEGIGLETIGLNPGWLETDGRQETAVPGVFACGDVTGMYLLAHAASAQGIIAVDEILGLPQSINFRNVPSCVYTLPEAASIGMNEDTARLAGVKTLVGRFPFSANGLAAAHGEREGFVKVVADADSKRVIGVQAVGHGACSLIHEAVGIMAGNATLKQVMGAIHAHPTFNEALAEACWAAGGQALHLPRFMSKVVPGG